MQLQARRGMYYDFLILGLTASCLLSGQSTAFSFNGMPIEPAPLLNARRRPPRLIELAPLSSARRRPPRFSISRGLRSSASTSDDDPEEEKEGLGKEILEVTKGEGKVMRKEVFWERFEQRRSRKRRAEL